MSKQNPIYALVGGGVQTIHRSDDIAELRRKADLHSTIFKRRYAVMRGDETVYETERAKVDNSRHKAAKDVDGPRNQPKGNGTNHGALNI